MSTSMTSLCAFVALTTCANLACAGALSTMTIDPAQSSLTMDVTLNVGASSTSSDSSTLSGEILLGGTTTPVGPTWIPLFDLAIHIDEQLNFNWSFGFLGGAQATMSDLDSSGAGDLLKDPASDPVGAIVDGGGNFIIPQVSTVLEGIVDASYNVLFVGNGAATIDLSTLGPAAADMPGTFTIVGDQGTIQTTITFEGEQPFVDDMGNEIGTVSFSGEAVIVATGTINFCPPDFTGEGTLDIFDVFAFLDAYANMDPSADFTGEGTFDIFDVFAFLDAYETGCP